MGLLEDIEKGASSFGSQVSSLATTVTNDAESFVRGAQNNVAALVNSGVNAAGQVTGPLADHFGKDPLSFVSNSVKFFDSFMRKLVTRMNTRTKQSSFKAATATGSSVNVSTSLTTKDPSARVALVVALYAIHFPAQLLEEAGREQQGLPVGRGLDGPYTWYPQYLPARGFFGIDEAAAAAAAIAIIVAIAPAIITGLISLIGAIAPQAVAAVTGVLGGNKPPPPPPGLFGTGIDPTIVIVLAAAVAAYILFVRHKKAA